jgi:membrane protease YdiL (CAAX protease family)
METPAIDLKTVGLALAAVLLVEWGTNAAVHHVALPPMLILGAARSLEIAAFISIALFFGDHGITALGIHTNRLLMGLKKGILWSIGFGILVGMAFGVLFFSGINPLHLMKTDSPSVPYKILLFFLVGGLVSPIAEEIFFRGILYGFFRRWGMGAAILISTLLFVMAHTTSSRIPVPQAIGGILFAVAYEKEKNLVVPMVIHISGNLAIFIISLVSQ